MSYIMHNLRVNVIAYIKKDLKEKKKIHKKEMRKAIMFRFSFSGQTADKYMMDMVEIGIAKNHGDFLEYTGVLIEEEKTKDDLP